MPSSFRDTVVAAFAALSHDPATIDALAPFYAVDVHFQDPIQTVTGRDRFLDVNRRLATRARELAFAIDRVSGDDREFFLTWQLRVRPRLGPAMTIEGVSHLRAAGGVIEFHRDYWDLAAAFASAVPGGARALRLALRPLA